MFLIDFRRVEGESTEWTMNHVRADQDVFEAEIVAAGFRRVPELEFLLKENYMLVFEDAHENPAVPPGIRNAPRSKKPAESALQFPILEGFGGVVTIADAVDLPRRGGKVVFDVTAESKKPEDVNKGLDRAARLLNLYGVSGLKASDVRLTVVLHGEATRSVLSDDAWKAHFDTDHNPNLPLIRMLQEARVEVLVCGQALSYKDFQRTDVAADIPVAAAAMSVVVNRQADGFSYLPVQ